jgi:hypothetical protein
MPALRALGHQPESTLSGLVTFERFGKRRKEYGGVPHTRDRMATERAGASESNHSQTVTDRKIDWMG